MTMEQDYLDFDELITFLDQKGYKWNARRTTDLLLEAITDSKLTPVFFYRGEITATYAKFVGENKWEEVKKDTCRLQGYFSANAYDLVDLYQDYFTCVPNALTFNGQHVRPYKIFGNPAPVATDHQKRTEGIDECFLHLSCGSFVEGHGHTVSEFLYPVEQLDSMFNRSSKDQPAIELEEGINQTLGANQKVLITYALFTPDQLVCLIINENPEFIKQDVEYLTHFRMVDIALESKELVPLEGTQNIPAQQVKVWLARNNYIYKDFNDNIPTDPVMQVRQLTEQLTDAQATIQQITNDYEKALVRIEAKEQSNASFMMGSPTVAYDEPETIEQFREALAAANAKIIDLDSQLTQAKAELVETPTHNQKVEKQGDSLLILGAVMHCIKEAAKKNFTQDLLTQTILTRYKNVSGISKSTLDKKYSEAKSYLEQRHTP